MTMFKNIPIRVEPDPASADTAIAKSVLHEVHALLESLLATGEGGTIDLRALPPLGPQGYGFLRESLGSGEVGAIVEGLRRTEIRETSYPGVWWVSHRNENNEIVTEAIEVAEVPVLLKSPRDDIWNGFARLSGRLPMPE